MTAQQKFKEWFKTSGTRKGWFAEQIGVTNQTLSKWINGHAMPSRMAQKVIEDRTNGAVAEGDWQ